MDQNQKLEEARRQATDLQKQLSDVRERGGDASIEARLERELAQIYQVIGGLTPAGPQPGSPYVPQPLGQPMGANYQESRATMILVFGILSIVVCQLFGPFAWSMGNDELRKVDQGIVDPRDRGNIQAGRICGIIGSALMIVWGVVVLGMIMAASTAANHY